MKITLCSSASFFEYLRGIQAELEKRGFEVLLPSMINYHSLDENALSKIQFNLVTSAPT